MVMDLEGRSEGNLGVEQIWAIQLGARLGRLIKEKHPEVADLYRSGMFMREIAQRYGSLLKNYSDDIKRTAVFNAINGFSGYGISPYDGLIRDPLEIEGLRLEHHSVAAEKGGIAGGDKSLREGTGIHRMTSEDNVRNGRKGGIKGGRKGGIECALAKGLTPWIESSFDEEGHYVPSEREFLHTLLRNPKYVSRKGKNKTDSVKATNEVNRVYHDSKPIRTISTIVRVLHQLRKLQGGE